MDRIDRKIIDILQTNARAPLKEIADRVFLSSPAVSARIAKLEKDGVLTGAGCPAQAGAAGQGVHKPGYGPQAQAGVLPLHPKLRQCCGVQLCDRRLQHAD